MADFSTKKNTSTVQNRVAGTSLSTHIIDPSTLPTFPGIGDTITFFDLPPGARIVDAWIKTNLAVAAAGTTLQLQVLQGATTTTITATIDASTAAPGASARMQIANGILDKSTVVSTIQAVVGTHALTIAGNIEVAVLWSFD